MNKLTSLALLLLLLLPPVTAVNVWEHINTSREMYFVKVLGRCRREPPLDPLNNSRIASVSIGYTYSDTQYIITTTPPTIPSTVSTPAVAAGGKSSSPNKRT
ncbi:hypothetical protein CL1_0674 [Thermococcus cleftensis]|uniref:Uncharacterized protein n=1 Tax=Thermococcus cleftensis (strain DSM 27260 / KACC 17922 / CL1) TaxID=163003 RepID=I3ZT45_THECF|nr:hypothetical protein [Thermococcus cleftensis]AFL94879.1 hypothetical protein CL1_0674 [Thermococcus cleftensis]